MGERIVTCENCGVTFPCETTEDAKLAEMRQNLGELPEHDRMTVCGECCGRFMARMHSGEPISVAGRKRLS